MVLILVLVFILVTTLAASSLVVVHQTQMRREREEQLLFVGDQYRKAINSYYNTVPRGGARTLPPSLEALLDDRRLPTPIHHLRRIYPDPMTGRPDWQLVPNRGAIAGIKSSSDQPTLKKKGFKKGYEYLEDRERYSDWVFSVRL